MDGRRGRRTSSSSSVLILIPVPFRAECGEDINSSDGHICAEVNDFCCFHIFTELGEQFNTVPKTGLKIVPKSVPKNPSKIRIKKIQKMGV